MNLKTLAALTLALLAFNVWLTACGSGTQAQTPPPAQCPGEQICGSGCIPTDAMCCNQTGGYCATGQVCCADGCIAEGLVCCAWSLPDGGEMSGSCPSGTQCPATPGTC
jgi:hypothetical protein